MPGRAIIHLIASNFFGGPERQVYEHALRCAQGPYEIVVVSFADTPRNEVIEHIRDAGIRGFLIPAAHPFDPRQIGAVGKIITETNASLLCTHNYKPRLVGGIAARMGHIPHIAVCRGRTWENRKVAFYNWLDWRIMRYANRVIAVSEAMGEQLCRAGIDPRKITTVHNAIDAESFRCRDNEARARLRAELGIGDECVFVSIGRLSPEKGHTYLIDAFSIVNERFPNTCLLLCGNGVEEAKLRYQVKSLGLAESVVFAGFRSDVANVLNAADVMVLPSLSEGLPNAVLEAFASGTPVIATRVGGVPELVFHEETGLLAEPIDAASLAEQMCRVTETDDLRMSLSNAARELVLSQFTFDEQTRKLEALYDEVLGVR